MAAFGAVHLPSGKVCRRFAAQSYSAAAAAALDALATRGRGHFPYT